MRTELEVKLQKRLEEIVIDYEESLACQKKYLQCITQSKDKIRDLEAQLSESQIEVTNKKYERRSLLQYCTCLRCWFYSCLKRVYPD